MCLLSHRFLWRTNPSSLARSFSIWRRTRNGGTASSLFQTPTTSTTMTAKRWEETNALCTVCFRLCWFDSLSNMWTLLAFLSTSPMIDASIPKEPSTVLATKCWHLWSNTWICSTTAYLVRRRRGVDVGGGKQILKLQHFMMIILFRLFFSFFFFLTTKHGCARMLDSYRPAGDLFTL